MADNQEKPSATLSELFWSFAKVGVMTFGGGMAMLPMLQREIVENKKWATDEEIANYFAVGQCTPGIIAVNTATFIGYKTRGTLGGIIATLGVVFPSAVIITLLAGIIKRFEENPYVTKAFMGIRACVVVLILESVLKLWKSAVKDKITLTIFLAAAVLAIIVDISPVKIVIAAIIVGIIYETIRSRKAESPAVAQAAATSSGAASETTGGAQARDESADSFAGENKNEKTDGNDEFDGEEAEK